MAVQNNSKIWKYIVYGLLGYEHISKFQKLEFE